MVEWRNTKGQLSWIRAAIRGCSEFSVAQFPLACTPQKYRNKQAGERNKWESTKKYRNIVIVTDWALFYNVIHITFWGLNIIIKEQV